MTASRWIDGDAADLEVVSDTDRHGKPLSTVINMQTGLVRNDSIPDDAELARFYAEDYRTSYKGAETPRTRQIIRNFRRAADHIRTFRDVLEPAGTVLDVGAGSGEFAYLMGQLGKNVTGIEPNAGYAAYCRDALGLDIQTAHLAPDLFEAGRFDLIRLNHVLEHLNDPVKYLSMIAAWLAPGGVLYVEVPNIETYAREIQTEEHGMGLNELLADRADHLIGIVNGVDYGEWSPEVDTLIPANYSAQDLGGKRTCRRALLSALGLAQDDAVPVFGIVSRLVAQKGFELLFEPLPELLAARDVRIAVLGSGERRYEEWFAGLQRRFPGRVCFYRGYDNPLAHLIEAGADAFLMPSLYEPCGLNQMYSLRYGTIPIVRRTGGLADTVQLYDRATGTGTGIVFDQYDAPGMRWALRYAMELWSDRPAWARMQQNAMARDFSWERQTGLYEALYHRLLVGAPA